MFFSDPNIQCPIFNIQSPSKQPHAKPAFIWTLVIGYWTLDIELLFPPNRLAPRRRPR
jgi:hypothetical protein